MDSLHVTIHTREGVVFSGNARALSGINNTGSFDVLPMHANFVTTLFRSIVVHTDAPTPHTYPLDRGLLWARSGNLIDIYIGIGGGNLDVGSKTKSRQISDFRTL